MLPAVNRRTLMAAAAAAAVAPAAKASPGIFPRGFLWGAATAGHQVEGNNTNADVWLLEQVKPTIFKEPSGDACDSLHRWADDLDLVRGMGLNCYRFSLEWARIEPEPGQFSIAMMDYYQRIIDGCRARGLTPMVTFNHFTAPRWFAAQGGWTNPDAADLFGRFCDRAARRLADRIGYATTLNEPDLLRLLRWAGMPASLMGAQQAMLDAAARATSSHHFVVANAATGADIDAMIAPMIAGHRQAVAAIKAARGNLPVGVSLAIEDDQPVGANSRRDDKRRDVYAAWLEAAKTGDFVGVQNYGRRQIDAHGTLSPPAGATVNTVGVEIYPESLANAVRYVHQMTGKPIMVTENGVGTNDDRLRAAYIPAVLAGLSRVMAEGVPVLGYVHWSLLDNFEWIFGYGPKYGLCSVDRTSFARVPKPSAKVYGAIARRNGA